MKVTALVQTRSWVRLLAAASVAGLGIGASGCSSFGSNDELPFSILYHEVPDTGLVDTVSVKGTVVAETMTAVSSTVTAPVASIDVKVGDRVEKGQVLIKLDSTELEKQLTTALAGRRATEEQANAAIADAREQLAQYQERLTRGLAPELNSAQASLRDAEQQLAQAQQDFEVARNERLEGRTPEILAQENSLDAARQAVFDSALAAARSGIASANSIHEGVPEDSKELIPSGPVNTHLSTAQAAAGLARANENLAEAQKLYNDTLARADRQLNEKQKAVADAVNRKRDAIMGVESAKLASAERLKQLQQGVKSAEREAVRVENSPKTDTDKLAGDISNSTIVAPKSGIITNISATVGAAPSGVLLTIADDTKLVLRTEVPETSLNELKLGQKAEITTRLTGNETFTGEVTSIAPVATGAGTSDSKGASGGSSFGGGGGANPSFAVDVTFAGSPEGVKIGGSGRARITTTEPDKGVAVPTSSIFEDDGTSYVLIFKPTGDNTYVVDKQAVTLGAKTDFDTSVTGDVKAGDKVIISPESFRDKVGTTTTVSPEPEAPPAEDSSSTEPAEAKEG